MKTMSIELRKLKLDDLETYRTLTHPDKLYHKFNGPYFQKETIDQHKKRIDGWRTAFETSDLNNIPQRTVIVDTARDALIGEVNWYWKSEETLWMEIGIVIFNASYWGMGLGYTALKIWIDHLFTENPGIVRLGLTTWSGNRRMMKLAEKLGMKQEACYRDARIVDGNYFDSVSYGILKHEWLTQS